MSLLTEGFEGSIMPAGWSALDGGDGASSITGYSGNAARLTNSAYSYGGYTSPAFTATTNILLDVWFRCDFNMYLSSKPIVQLLSGTTPLIAVVSGSGSTTQYEIYQYSGTSGSSVATTTNYFAENTWHHLLLEANLITGGTATLTINGTVEISAAMGNYGNGASGATKLALITAPFTNVDYDTLDISAAGGGGGSSSRWSARTPRGLCRGVGW